MACIPANKAPRLSGFTLVEMLIVAPIIIIMISGFIALMINMVGEVLVTRDQNALTYETQDALNRIEQDTRLTTQFLTTSGTLVAPQGSDSNFTGTTAFSNTNSLILSGLTTDKNPSDTTRQLVFYSGQPNVCGPQQNYNRPFLTKIMYFIKDGSLWRRTVLPDYNTNLDNAVCATPWQRNSCSVGYSSSRCQTNDTELVKNIDTFSIKYFANSQSTVDLDASQALSATTIEVTINGKKTTAGRPFTTSGSIRATRLNSIDVDIPAPGAPTVTGQVIDGTTVRFTWPKVPLASSYDITHSTNGGASTPFTNSSQQTTVDVTTGVQLGDTVTIRVTARNSTGPSSAYGEATVTVPYWNTCNLQNSWVNYGSTYTTAAYTKTSQRVVVLKGLVKGGGTAVDTTICTLPSDFRPAVRLMFPVSTNGGPEGHGQQGRIDILPTGQVNFIEGSNSWISLDAVRFVASTANHTWTANPLVNGWQRYDTGWPTMESTLDGAGRTHIHGLVKGGTYTPNGTPMAQIPVAHRPAQYTHFPAKSNAPFNYVAFGANVDAKGINPNLWYNVQAMFYPAAFAGWTNLPLQSGWVSFDSGGHSTPQYTKSVDKIVTVKGLIKNGTATAGTIIANLPVGYRPKERVINHCVAWGAYCRVDILPDGNIEIRKIEYNGWASLDAISFVAD